MASITRFFKFSLRLGPGGRKISTSINISGRRGGSDFVIFHHCGPGEGSISGFVRFPVRPGAKNLMLWQVRAALGIRPPSIAIHNAYSPPPITTSLAGLRLTVRICNTRSPIRLGSSPSGRGLSRYRRWRSLWYRRLCAFSPRSRARAAGDAPAASLRSSSARSFAGSAQVALEAFKTKTQDIRG